MEVIPFPARGSSAPLVETPYARAFLLEPGAPAPEGTDALVTLADARRFAYVPIPSSQASDAALLTVDPFVNGSRFMPLHQSSRALAAQISIAAARRVDTGPESERLFLFLRGSGLLFDQNGDTMRIAPEHVAVAPAGEPARLWAQGPEDMLAIVFQPNAERAPRRTLSSEIAKRRAPDRPSP